MWLNSYIPTYELHWLKIRTMRNTKQFMLCHSSFCKANLAEQNKTYMLIIFPSFIILLVFNVSFVNSLFKF